MVENNEEGIFRWRVRRRFDAEMILIVMLFRGNKSYRVFEVLEVRKSWKVSGIVYLVIIGEER